MARGDDEARRTPALVFCFNRDECWAVAEAIKGRPLLEPAATGPARRGTQTHRLVARGRAEAAATAHSRRRRPSRRAAAEAPPHRRRPFPAQAPLRGRLHGDAFLGHQSSRAVGRLADDHEGSAGKDEGAGAQRGAPDFRPRRPAAVRHGRLRLRVGPRGRRADRPLGGEVQSDPRGDEGPGPVEGAKGPGAEAAEAAGLGAVLEPGAVPEAGGLAAGQAAQPRTAPLAALGLHARRLAGGRSDPHPGGQAADGFAADRIGPAGPRSDAAGAAPRGIRAAGAGAARRGPAAAGTAEDSACQQWNERFDAEAADGSRKSRRIGRRWPIPRANWRS